MQATNSNISLVQNAINQLQVADAVYGEAMAPWAHKECGSSNQSGNAGADTSAVTAQLAGHRLRLWLRSSTNVQYNGPAVLVTAARTEHWCWRLDRHAEPPTHVAAVCVVATTLPVTLAAAAAIADLRATNGGQHFARCRTALQVLNCRVQRMSWPVSVKLQDTDIATEMMSLTSANIMTEAATAMLAQAMQLPNSVLKLLQ